jgi:hypothetical protein
MPFLSLAKVAQHDVANIRSMDYYAHPNHPVNVSMATRFFRSKAEELGKAQALVKQSRDRTRNPYPPRVLHPPTQHQRLNVRSAAYLLTLTSLSPNGLQRQSVRASRNNMQALPLELDSKLLPNP